LENPSAQGLNVRSTCIAPEAGRFLGSQNLSWDYNHPDCVDNRIDLGAFLFGLQSFALSVGLVFLESARERHFICLFGQSNLAGLRSSKYSSED
jgi:hypothetical protein